MSEHARLFSPSKSEGWFACPGRSVMEAPFPDRADDDAYNGSARHLVCGSALLEGKDVAEFVGREIVFWRHDASDSSGECFREDLGDDPDCDILKTVEYRDDWEEEDQDYVTTALAIASGQPYDVELKVDFSRYTGAEDDSFGRLDFGCVRPLDDGTFELVVMDRKTGRHTVTPERNKQLMLYALGRYQELELVYDISRVRLVVHQRQALEWDCSIDELLRFGSTEVRLAALHVQQAVDAHGKIEEGEWQQLYLNPKPTEQACAYCRAMATCPSYQRAVQAAVDADFEVIEDVRGQVQSVSGMPALKLSQAMAVVGLVEDWCEAVRSRVRQMLMSREEVPGFKLVQSRQGNREWKDAAATEAYLKDTVRLTEPYLYTRKLISPTRAEALAKEKVLGPGQWRKLQEAITRAAPAISVVPATDKREAYLPQDAVDDFETLPGEPGVANP